MFIRSKQNLCFLLLAASASACAATAPGATGEDANVAADVQDGAAAAPPVRDPIFDTPFPSFDPLQQVPAADVDLSKDVHLLTPACQHRVDDFSAYSVPVGQKMPDLTLWNASGEQVSLSQYAGKSAVLLVLGASSCPVFRDMAQPWFPKVKALADSLTAKTGRRLELVVVYAQEAHPAIDPSPYSEQQWTDKANVDDKVLVRQPTTFAERVTLVRGLLARFPLDPAGVWIDGMDNAAWTLLGQLPNTIHLIDQDGTVVYAEPWAFGNEPPNGDGPAPLHPDTPVVMEKIRALLDP